MRGRSYSYSPSPPRYRSSRRNPSPSPRGRYGGRARDLPTSLLVRNLRPDCRLHINCLTKFLNEKKIHVLRFTSLFFGSLLCFRKAHLGSPGTITMINLATLMDDAEGNGVKGYVFLKTKDVPYFEEALDGVINAFAA